MLPPNDPHGLSPSSGHRRRRGWRAWLLVLLAFLVIDAAWVGFNLAGLPDARDDLQAGADALLEGRIDRAGARFDRAARVSGRAEDLGRHPVGWLAGRLPWLGDDVHAVRALAEAGELTAGAGARLVEAARRTGWRGGEVPGLGGDAGLSPGALDAAAPELGEAAAALRHGEQVLADVSVEGLLGPVRDAVITARGELAGRAELVSTASDLSRLLPSLLVDGRRYLLIIQNPAEPRGTGGFMGFYGFLKARKARLELSDLFPAGGQPSVEPVSAPADYVERYERFFSLVDLRQSNFTPDLPTAAGVILQLGADRGWGKFDGVFMVDMVWMRDVLGALGPVRAPSWSEPITADNVLPVLAEQVSVDEASNRIQGQIAKAVWTAFQHRDVSAAGFATALAKSVKERHLQVYSTHPGEQATLRRLGATGETTLGKNPLAVVWQGIGANKLGWFIERGISVDVQLNDRGTAIVTTTLRMRNDAPAGPPGELLGGGEDYPVGTFAAYVSVYMPETIEGNPYFEASGRTVTGLEREFGRPVALGFMQARSRGGTYSWSVRYLAPGAVTREAGADEYRLDYLPQPTFEPMPVSVTIHLPEGTQAVAAAPGVAVDGSTVTFRDALTTDRSIWVRYA